MFGYNKYGDVMKELYIDFDGVILNTIDVSYKELQKLGIDKKDTENVIKYYQQLDWRNFLKSCSQINNSIDCIRNIIDCKKFLVTILTHVSSLDEAIEKIKYIRKYFRDITIIPVPKKISKVHMVHTEGAILIDDYTGNLKEWEEAGGVGVRFSEKMSGKGYLVVDHLDQIIKLNEEGLLKKNYRLIERE